MPLRGLHVNVLDSATLGTLRRARPALVKTLDTGQDWARLRAECDVRFLVARIHMDADATLSPSPEVAAERLWQAMWPKLRVNRDAWDAIETPWNERYHQGGELVGHARGCRRFCELAAGEGLAVAVGNFSVGTPEPDEFAEVFAPAMEVAAYLSLHEYWLPDDFGRPWWVGRWARLLAALPEDLRRLVIISECGIDGGLEKPPRTRSQAGWRAYGLTGAQYTQQLAAYVDSFDGRVMGATVFNAGDYPDQKWRSFDVAGVEEVEAWLAAGPRTWQTLPPPPPPPAEEKPVAKLITDFEQVTYPTWRELAPWPYEWDQLNDWSFDADGDQGRGNNCGPQSVAASLQHLGMGEWSGDVVREVVAAFYGGSQADYLQVEHLTKFLRRFAGIECDTYQGDGNTLLRPVVEESITLGYPLIVLFAWDYDRFNETGHFMPVVGYDASGVYCHQVWGGGRVFMAWDEFEAWQKYGTALRLRRRRSSQISRY